MDPSLLEFCLYMAFWPTVLSGPICRLPSMLPQFRQLSPFSWDDLSAGSLRFIQGVIMKFVLAQILVSGWLPGEGIAAGFDQMKGGWGGVDVWLLGIGFGFLLFFDFAGYSHMVIGAARIFGIRLPENFDRPFLSTTPSIFWTRWHMSLSFWIRDYVFNPLAAAGRRYSWWPYVVLDYFYDFLWVVAWGEMDLHCLWCVPRFDISNAPFGPADETTIFCPPATKFGSFSIVGNYVFAGFSRVYHFSRR